MALEKIRPRVVDETGNYTFNNVTATGNLVSLNANLGNIAVANYVKTDNLLYANGSPWSFGGGGGATVSGSNTQVQFNNAGSFGSSANFVFDSSTNRLTVDNITANGAALTNLTGANVTGTVGNANYAAYAGNITIAAQSNITSVGTLSSLAVTGNISSGNANLGNFVIANFFSGSGNNLSNIQASNITGAVAYATTANSVAGANVSGAVAYAATANAVAGANVLGDVANATYAVNAGTAYSVSASNISGTINLANFATTANAIAGANVSGFVANANVANTAYSVSAANITGTINLANFATTANSVAGANVSGFVANANIANTAYAVAGANVSGQVGNALVAGTVYTNAQPNITSVGTLSSLAVTGNISGANVSITGTTASTSKTTGALTVAGGVGISNDLTVGNSITVDNGSYGNVVITQFASIFATGSGPNPRAIYQATAADGVAGIGIQAYSGLNGQIYSNTGFTFTTGATVRDKDFPTGGTTRVTIDSNGLAVTGNITSTNANLGNAVTANYFVGSGIYVTGVAAATAATVTTNAQPNITSVGTLTSLIIGNATANTTFGNGTITATGNISFTGANVSLGDISNLKITGGTVGYFITTDGAGNLSWGAAAGGGGVSATGSNTQIQFNDGGALGASANLVFNKTTNTFTTGRVVASAGANLGSNVSNVYIGGGSSAQILSTDGSGNLSWIAQPVATMTVDNFTGDGTTTAFTLSTTPTSKNFTVVNYNGAFQLREAYSISGTTITFSEAPSNGSKIEVTTTSGATSGAGSFVTRSYTGNGVATTFTVTSGVTVSSVIVTENGLVQTPTVDYTIAGSTLTFAAAPANGISVQIRELAIAIVTAPAATSLNAAVANVIITGGSSGQALVTDGAGNISFGTAGVPTGKVVALNMFLGF